MPPKVDLQVLVAAARRARKTAYAPYSKYRVGAAVVGKSGRIYSGSNIENSAYPTSICAERVAIFKAISEGERKLLALAVATSNAGSPCGSCRQVFSEFADDDAAILLVGQRGRQVKVFSMKDMLPERFGPDQLVKG